MYASRTLLAAAATFVGCSGSTILPLTVIDNWIDPSSTSYSAITVRTYAHSQVDALRAAASTLGSVTSA